MAVLSIIAIVYGALASLMQKDWKKLVAYSSVSHLGFCTLGIFALNPAGIAGSILQQINHGISTGMLFLIVGVVYERRHTREISEYGGLLQGDAGVHHRVPDRGAEFDGHAAARTASSARSRSCSGAYQMSFNWAFWGAVGIALGAAYLLWLFQRTMLGEMKEKNRLLKDLSWREIAVFAPLVVWAFWIGLNPQPYFRVLERPVAQIVERVHPGYYARAASAEPAGSARAGAEALPRRRCGSAGSAFPAAVLFASPLAPPERRIRDRSYRVSSGALCSGVVTPGEAPGAGCCGSGSPRPPIPGRGSLSSALTG